MKYLITLLFAFLVQLSCVAQINHDLELWAGSSIQYKINKRLKVYVEPEVRFNNNISQIKSVFSDFALKVKLSKRWSLKGACRYSVKPNNSNKIRTNLDLIFRFKKKKKKLGIRNRIRGQYGYEFDNGNFDIYLREQVLFDYNLTKLVDPYAGGEIFFKFRNNEFRQFRILAGLDWKIYKWWHLNTFYIYQREIFNANPSGEHVIGLSNKFLLKKPKMKSNSNL